MVSRQSDAVRRGRRRAPVDRARCPKTADADTEAVRRVAESIDLCLLPVRQPRLDVDAAAATCRAVFLANRRSAFVLDQCPPIQRSLRSSEAADQLMRLGVLAEPKLAARIDFSDAIAAGMVVTEYPAAAKRRRKALWGGLVALDEATSQNGER